MIKDVGALSVIPEISNQRQLDIAVEGGAALLQGAFLGEALSAKDLQQNSFNAQNIRVA